MAKKREPIPDFAGEAEEREFWETNDSTPYLDWGRARRVRFPNLKLTTTSPRPSVERAEPAEKAMG